MAEYSNHTALGQPTIKKFPKSGGGVVQTTYEYYPQTGRLKKLYADGLTITDNTLNNMTHNYTYDALNRLVTAKGNNGSAYNHTYTYDRIGNIKTKPDVVGEYKYTYTDKPHAVRYTGTGNPIMGEFTLQYDPNGNMTQKNVVGIITTMQWNYDNKPTSITRDDITVSFTYDGNGQRVKKAIAGGQTVLYFGNGYEKRGGVGIIHLFAGNQRIASVRSDGTTQFYHPDHLGSSWIVTDNTVGGLVLGVRRVCDIKVG